MMLDLQIAAVRIVEKSDLASKLFDCEPQKFTDPLNFFCAASESEKLVENFNTFC